MKNDHPILALTFVSPMSFQDPTQLKPYLGDIDSRLYFQTNLRYNLLLYMGLAAIGSFLALFIMLAPTPLLYVGTSKPFYEFLSIYLSIDLSIYRCIYRSITLSITLSLTQSITLSITLSINLSLYNYITYEFTSGAFQKTPW
jgi:hypothetical protein